MGGLFGAPKRFFWWNQSQEVVPPDGYFTFLRLKSNSEDPIFPIAYSDPFLLKLPFSISMVKKYKQWKMISGFKCAGSMISSNISDLLSFYRLLWLVKKYMITIVIRRNYNFLD